MLHLTFRITRPQRVSGAEQARVGVDAGVRLHYSSYLMSTAWPWASWRTASSVPTTCSEYVSSSPWRGWVSTPAGETEMSFLMPANTHSAGLPFHVNVPLESPSSLRARSLAAASAASEEGASMR